VAWLRQNPQIEGQIAVDFGKSSRKAT